MMGREGRVMLTNISVFRGWRGGNACNAVRLGAQKGEWSISRGANPGTDSQFPANCAGNLVSVPGLRRISAHLLQKQLSTRRPPPIADLRDNRAMTGSLRALRWTRGALRRIDTILTRATAPIIDTDRKSTRLNS